ncbi:MAG: enolase C-terminal domain-like protein [Candidatus Aenigmatarchaeota archaeon]
MIKDIVALPVWNGKCGRTLRVYVKTENKTFSATAPTGESKGKWEAATISMAEIAKVFPELKRLLIGKNETEWDRLDALVEAAGGKDLERIGSLLGTALTMALTKAGTNGQVWQALSDGRSTSFPFPVGNAVGGGAHGGHTSIQEFLVIPAKAKTMAEAIETNITVWREIGQTIKAGGNFGRDDEGAWITNADDVKTLDLVTNIAEANGCLVGIDVAAGQLMHGNKYVWPSMAREFDSGEQLEFLKMMAEKYRLAYIEDPFDARDSMLWAEFNSKSKALVVADDLACTQPHRVTQIAQAGQANAVIIKPDQAGTVGKTLRAIDAAKNGRMIHVVSHRGQDTCETFIADLAVGTEAPLIKCGIAGGERVAKLNRLMEIWAGMSEKGRPEMARLKLRA